MQNSSEEPKSCAPTGKCASNSFQHPFNRAGGRTSNVKMNPLTIIGMLLLAVLPTVPAEDDPFAKSAGVEVRPQRTILKLPKAVTHRMIDATKHEYTISGIYSASAKNDELKDVASTYKIFVPDSLEFDLDFKARMARFSTSRELTLSELAYAIDDMAKLGGDIPFWVELEARDMENTKDLPRIRYTIKATAEDAPPELAWFWVPKDRAFQVPLSLGGPELGSLLVVPSTAFCMCHSKFNLRILDPEGKLIWKEEDTAYAGVRIALSNANEFGMHKIWLTRDDHGESTKFLISGHLIKEQQIEQPVPSGGHKPSSRVPSDGPAAPAGVH